MMPQPPCPECRIVDGIPYCEARKCPLLCPCTPRLVQMVAQIGTHETELACLIQNVRYSSSRLSESIDAGEIADAAGWLHRLDRDLARARQLLHQRRGAGDNPRT